MPFPTAYLTTTKNVDGLFNAIQSAKAPAKFTQRFLEQLDFKSSSDRLFINVLKALGFLTADGTPTPRYFDYLDQSQAGRVLAEAIEEAYADLFQVRRDAQKMERPELKGKIKTLTQGQVSDAVVEKMATTFLALVKLADWEAPRPSADSETPAEGVETEEGGETAEQRREQAENVGPRHRLGGADGGDHPGAGISLGGFVYNVELHLPESRDPAVYEVLFKALKTHLLS
jgi:hypothetical protein